MKTYTNIDEQKELGHEIHKMMNYYFDDIREKEKVSEKFILDFLASIDELRKYFDIEDDMALDEALLEKYDYIKIKNDINESFYSFVISEFKKFYDEKSDEYFYSMYGCRCGILENFTYSDVVKFGDFKEENPTLDKLFDLWKKHLNKTFKIEKYEN